MGKKYPTIQQIEKLKGQEVLFEAKRSPRSILSHVMLFLLLISFIAILSYFFPHARLSEDLPVLRHISFRWLAIFPSLVLLEMIRKYHDDLYIFGHHRLTHLDGRLSLSYSIPVIKFIDVRAIAVHQDIVGRVFNYGDVELSTAAQEGSELLIKGVIAPGELAELIDRLRSRSREMARAGSQDSKQDFIESVFEQMSKVVPTTPKVETAPMVMGESAPNNDGPQAKLPPESGNKVGRVTEVEVTEVSSSQNGASQTDEQGSSEQARVSS